MIGMNNKQMTEAQVEAIVKRVVSPMIESAIKDLKKDLIRFRRQIDIANPTSAIRVQNKQSS